MAANKLPTSTTNPAAAPVETFTDELLGVAADEEELPVGEEEEAVPEEPSDVLEG